MTHDQWCTIITARLSQAKVEADLARSRWQDGHYVEAEESARTAISHLMRAIQLFREPPK